MNKKDFIVFLCFYSCLLANQRVKAMDDPRPRPPSIISDHRELKKYFQWKNRDLTRRGQKTIDSKITEVTPSSQACPKKKWYE